MVASAAMHKLSGFFFTWPFCMKPFQKPAIDIPAQLALLKQRGLSIQDEAKAHCFLEAVSFFRLTPYMRPFQIPEDADHAFKAGTRLRDLTRLYDFDRRLRLLVIDAIERIEVHSGNCPTEARIGWALPGRR